MIVTIAIKFTSDCNDRNRSFISIWSLHFLRAYDVRELGKSLWRENLKMAAINERLLLEAWFLEILGIFRRQRQKKQRLRRISVSDMFAGVVTIAKIEIFQRSRSLRSLRSLRSPTNWFPYNHYDRCQYIFSAVVMIEAIVTIIWKPGFTALLLHNIATANWKRWCRT